MFDIILNNVCLSYSGSPIFTNLNATFHRGEWSSFLGGSGVGKSSLLRVIAGLIRTNLDQSIKFSGSIFCQDGVDLHNRLCWMSQKDLLLPWLTVLENVTLGDRLRGSWFSYRKILQDKKERALDILEQVGLREMKNMLPEKLSGGERQRVALARTLMEDRSIVLMDEPFSALDVITRVKLQNLASKLLKNKTVLLITHDPLEALRLSHYVYLLQGRPVDLIRSEIPQGVPPRSLKNNDMMKLNGQFLAKMSSSME